MARMKVPVEIDGFALQRVAGGFKVCGTVEVPGIGRVPICKNVSDDALATALKKAREDVQDELRRFTKKGGIRGWFVRYLAPGEKPKGGKADE